jgi:hypothetical protein
MARKRRRPDLARIRAGDFTLFDIAAHDDWTDDEVAALEAQGVYGASTDEDREALETFLASPPAFLTPDERRAVARPLGRYPDHTLSDSERALLWSWFNDDETPPTFRRIAALLLSSWGALAHDRPMPKRPPPPSDPRGKRHDDAAVFAAVADALADGVEALGRDREAGRGAKGYGAWREVQPNAKDLPTARRIRGRFSDRRTKRDRDAWATVLRLGRKAGAIPPKS